MNGTTSRQAPPGQQAGHDAQHPHAAQHSPVPRRRKRHPWHHPAPLQALRSRAHLASSSLVSSWFCGCSPEAAVMRSVVASCPRWNQLPTPQCAVQLALLEARRTRRCGQGELLLSSVCPTGCCGSWLRP